MINDGKWWPNYGRNGGSGNICCGSWYRRGEIFGRPYFFKAVVQAILLPGLEMWLVTPCNNQTLGVFYNRLYICLTVKKPWRSPGGR